MIDGIEDYFIWGVQDFDEGVSVEDMLDFMSIFLEVPLEGMAYYDGYIRRKYGLVDKNGEEV